MCANDYYLYIDPILNYETMVELAKGLTCGFDLEHKLAVSVIQKNDLKIKKTSAK